MNEVLVTVTTSVITAVVLPLLGFATKALITWIQSKANNEKAVLLLTTANNIVSNSVNSVFQTYVDSLKASGSFDKEAQNIAFSKAKECVLKQITPEIKSCLQANFSDVDQWITHAIESSVLKIKNNSN